MQNYSLFFIRHGKLKLPYKDHSEIPFKVLADLALSKFDPPMDKNFTLPLIRQLKIPLGEIEKIYSSPSKRCLETSKLVSNFIRQKFLEKIPIIVMSELAEVRFNLEKIYPHPKRNQFDIEAINDKVFRAMANGKNCEQVLGVYKRVEKIFSIIENNEENKKVLFVTHDFLMRVIEIFIKHHGKVESPITYLDLKKTKRNLYLRGFATDHSLSTFSLF